MKTMLRFFVDSDPNKVLCFEPKRLINAGYTGRNQEAVRAHVEELRKVGIPAPQKTPVFFPKAADLIRQEGVISALDKDCSGEVEFVLLATEDGWYITVGCDVFDFRVEGFQSDKSKCLYPNYLAASAWRYEDVKDHWDELVLRSWIGPDHATLYQEGTLSQILHVEDMVEMLKPCLVDGVVPGTVLSGGSLGCFVEGMPYMECFEFELEDPVLNRKIKGSYTTERITWFSEN